MLKRLSQRHLHMLWERELSLQSRPHRTPTPPIKLPENCFDLISSRCHCSLIDQFISSCSLFLQDASQENRQFLHNFAWSVQACTPGSKVLTGHAMSQMTSVRGAASHTFYVILHDISDLNFWYLRSNSTPCTATAKECVRLNHHKADKLWQIVFGTGKANRVFQETPCPGSLKRSPPSWTPMFHPQEFPIQGKQKNVRRKSDASEAPSTTRQNE